MDLAINNQPNLICHKTQPTNQTNKQLQISGLSGHETLTRKPTKSDGL